MDIFILDTLLRPVDVVDEYISFIWTERWAEMGDFQIVTLATPNNRRRWAPDTKLSITQSKRVMIVETIEETNDVENGVVLNVKGRCLNMMLEKRPCVRYSTLSGAISVSWDTYGWTPLELPVLYFMSICYYGDSSPGDIIPFIQETGGLYPPENIPDPWPVDFEWSTKPMDMYTAIRNICTAYDIGFRFYKHPTESKLYFEATMGSDRTTQQVVFPPVIFSQDMANLIDTTEFTDYTKYYNAILVVYYYKDEFDNDVTMSEFVKASELDFSDGGFDQKVKMLSVTQIPEEMELVDVPAYLIKLGEEELGRNLPVNVYDGEIAKNSEYVYEVDYNLGDIVEVRSIDGGTAYMRVVEQIFKCDSAGEAAYPSLITKAFVNPGTWASWKYDIEWSAMGSTEYWSNQ
jgi:hypothetical protein